MINRTFAFGIQFPKHMCANDIYPFSTLNRYVGYSPHTFPTWKLTYRNETHRTQHAKDEHPNKFKSVELCDLQCAIRDIFLEEKKTSRTMKILSLKQCRECHLLMMQRRISRKFNSYNARGAFFLKPCFYSDASGQRSTKPYYISYKSNFVQNPIIAFVNQPLANTKKTSILSTISWPMILHWIRYGCNRLHKNCSPCHKDRCERVRCFEQQKDDYITILHPILCIAMN